MYVEQSLEESLQPDMREAAAGHGIPDAVYSQDACDLSVVFTERTNAHPHTNARTRRDNGQGVCLHEPLRFDLCFSRVDESGDDS